MSDRTHSPFLFLLACAAIGMWLTESALGDAVKFFGLAGGALFGVAVMSGLALASAANDGRDQPRDQKFR